MGEEYGEPRPFLYFTSHTDEALVEAVREGRRAEFAAFAWAYEVPDPQDEATFGQSKLQPEIVQGDQACALRDYHRELLRLRRELPALAELDRELVETLVLERERVLFVRRGAAPGVRPRPVAPVEDRDRVPGSDDGSEVCMAFSFADNPCTVEVPVPAGRWARVLDSADARWLGPGSQVPAVVESDGAVSLALQPHGVVVLARQDGEA
jgi:maltooligosyltrehalose trehalohydrolase